MKLSRRGAAIALLVLGALFVARLVPDAGTLLRDADEAHFCAAAARLAVHGGPLYGNALVTKGPVIYWLLAPVFRLAGACNMVAVRVAMAAWWLATAWAVYLAARALTGRAAAVVAAGAFLLAALNPGFRSARADALVPLPMAVALALCLRSGGRRGIALATAGGVAAGLAFLTKQQAAVALPALAGFPLLTWWGRRAARTTAEARSAPGRHLGLALCQSALVVAGFVLAVAAAWLWYACRGAGHEFVYCVWSYNWLFLRHTPSGGLLPSAGFFAARVVRYLAMEPLLGAAFIGAAAGLAWRGPEPQAGGPIPWRAGVAGLALAFGAAWLAASPGDIPATSMFAYVAYASQLYVPMCLLIGVAVETALGARRQRGLLAAALVAVLLVYVVLPACRPVNTVLLRAHLQWTAFPWWHVPATLAGLGAAAWLLGGRGLVPFALCVWLLAYVSGPWALGWVGSQPAAAVCLVGLGLLWRAAGRRWLWLAAVAGIVHLAGCWLDWLPTPGLALGAALWVATRRDIDARERWALAGAYVIPVLCLAIPLLVSQVRTLGQPSVYWAHVLAGRDVLATTLPDVRLTIALALAGLLCAFQTGGRAAARRSPLGLLGFAGLGALAAALVLGPTTRFLTPALLALALAAALGARILLLPRTQCEGRRGPMVLAGAVAAALLAALALGLLSPGKRQLREEHRAAIEAIGSPPSMYVWSTVRDVELYVRVRAVPALPQVCPWTVADVGPTTRRSGVFGHPRLATLEGVDESLAERQPPVLVVGRYVPDPAAFPRFGPILESRYRLVASPGDLRIYRLRKGALRDSKPSP